MNKAQLLGYTKNEIDSGVNNDGHEEGCIDYTFYIKIGDVVFSFYAQNSWGSCGSGYTGASWGHLEYKLREISPVSFFNNFNKQIPGLVRPTKDTYLTLFNGELQRSIQDSENFNDSTVESVKSDDGEVIVYSTGDGGCQYYSSGTVVVNDKLFINEI